MTLISDLFLEKTLKKINYKNDHGNEKYVSLFKIICDMLISFSFQRVLELAILCLESALARLLVFVVLIEDVSQPKH